MEDPTMSVPPGGMGAGAQAQGGDGRDEKITRDPRTRLPIMDVPKEHAKYFSGLKGTVMHWFGVVDKFNRMWKPDRRVAIFSDSCIYLCRLDGGITRCAQVRNIARVLIGEDSAIGFQINQPDYDMLLQMGSVAERETVLNVVKHVYFRLVGRDLEVTNLSDEASAAMQSELKLAKPPGASLRIEPIRSLKSLMKMMDDQKKKEEEDKRVVEMEFKRIKEGLRQELQQYRTEEYERMVDQLAKHAKALEEKDREIIRLKQETVSKDDPELWKQCPNCAKMHERLSSNSNDDKQRIMRLEREIESQRHIMEHLQAAIQHRSTQRGIPGAGSGDGGADSAQVEALRQELADANQRNKELQSLIMQSNVLTAEVKQRAARIASHREGGSGTTGYTTGDWAEVVADKDREVKHLKSLLKDATFRHVQELESIRAQFRKYDEHIVAYLEKVFSGAIAPSGRGGNPAQMAAATADAARDSAGSAGYGASSTGMRMAGGTAAVGGGGGYAGSVSSPPRGSMDRGSAASMGGSSYRPFDPAGNGAYGGAPSPASPSFASAGGVGGGGGGRGMMDAMSPIPAVGGSTPSFAAPQSSAGAYGATSPQGRYGY